MSFIEYKIMFNYYQEIIVSPVQIFVFNYFHMTFFYQEVGGGKYFLKHKEWSHKCCTFLKFELNWIELNLKHEWIELGVSHGVMVNIHFTWIHVFFLFEKFEESFSKLTL